MGFTTTNFGLFGYSTTGTDLTTTFDLARAVTNNFTSIDAKAVPRYVSALDMTGSYSTSGSIRAASFTTAGTINAVNLNITGAATIGSVSNVEFGYLDGATSNIQNQLDQKLISSIITLFAGTTFLSTTSTTEQPIYSSMFTWDYLLYPGARNAYFEAVAASAGVGAGAVVILEDTSGNNLVSVSVAGTTSIVRSSSIIPTNGTDYRVSFKTNGVGTAYVYAARIIITT